MSTGKSQNPSKSDNSSTINKDGQHLLSSCCLFFKHMLTKFVLVKILEQCPVPSEY